MFRLFARQLPHFNQGAARFSHFARSIKPQPLLRTATIASLPLFMYLSNTVHCNPLKRKQQPIKFEALTKVDPRLVQNPQTFWGKFKSIVSHVLRMLQLVCIFLPPLMTLPLRLFRRGQKLWLDMFVWSVQKAGVVWIKAFQYLSHRRDVIGAEMAQSFNHLRQSAPQHSFEQTKKIFKLAFGKDLSQIFDQFDTTPIASGSVSQVYKAVYQGKKVAVKVRHPEVDKYIQRDVNIMFGISKFLSLFSKSFQIPVGESSLKKTLIDQIDFNVQKDNLNIFNNHFHGNQHVKFPQAFETGTRDSVLIESFVEGVPVTHFQTNRHPLNAVIARLGATAFFEMLMKNNFIHADCHGGNILVEITKQSATFFSQVKAYVADKFYQLEEKIIESMLENETLKRLYKSSKDEEREMRNTIRKCTDKVKINLIDVGMVIKLNEHDRLNFTNFIKSIMEGNSENCAQMIYKLSNFDGHRIIEGKFQEYKNQLKKLFSVLDNTSIFDIEGINLLIGMLNIIRENNMKLDGEFATLITNMVVMESIAKEIDPNIQILKCAIPYFQFVEDPNQSTQQHEKVNPIHGL